MNLLASNLDTVECAYYLRPGAACKLDFEVQRALREEIRQSKHPEAGVLSLGGMDFMLSPNGSKSGYPFISSNQDCTIQFGEFNDPSFFVKYSSVARWCKGAKFFNERFFKWAESLGMHAVRSEGLSRVYFAFDFHLPVTYFVFTMNA